MIPVYRPKAIIISRDDGATVISRHDDRARALRDALKLAEQAKAYTDGEQWAVTAVRYLRALAEGHMDDCASHDGAECDCF